MPVSSIELTLGLRVLAWVRAVLRHRDPVALIKRRESVRDEIRSNLHRPDAQGEVPEIAVVRVGKEEHYGRADTRLLQLGPSPWYKFEVKEPHDRGLEVFDSIQNVTIRKGKAHRVRTDEMRLDMDMRRVWVVGRIPYERIAHIDWKPDPYYSSPRLYVAYGRRGPFKEVVLYQGDPQEYLYEMNNVKYKVDRGGPIRRAGRFMQRVRFNVRNRRWQSRLRDAS